MLTFDSNQNEQTVVIKGARHFRIQNERNVLERFQSRTTNLRPLVDGIEDPSDPPAIVLKHLDDDLLEASDAKQLTIPEIKYVSKKVLEALKVLHGDGFVHTDIKLDNVLVNYGQGDTRFRDVQLADCENTVHVDSKYCKDRDLIGAPYWRSPEAQLGLQWGPPTDIWSLRTMIISLIWGKNFFIFRPDVPPDHEEYVVKILMKYHQYFGPYPPSYRELADEGTLAILSYVMDSVPHEQMKPFSCAGEREILREDKNFVLNMMKMDPRDRPTAKELLEDVWFEGV
ncbi:hypothetical protein MMC30_007831 [Trapelia coarctata]|nr:hypothetical protein [Trapelia coarctata]